MVQGRCGRKGQAGELDQAGRHPQAGVPPRTQPTPSPRNPAQPCSLSWLSPSPASIVVIAGLYPGRKGRPGMVACVMEALSSGRTFLAHGHHDPWVSLIDPCRSPMGLRRAAVAFTASLKSSVV